jgi:hypothetical protein
MDSRDQQRSNFDPVSEWNLPFFPVCETAKFMSSNEPLLGVTEPCGPRTAQRDRSERITERKMAPML